jgi:hypothetical protein
LNDQKPLVVDPNELFVIQSSEIKETVARTDDKEVATIFGQSENGNFRAIGSVPYCADKSDWSMIVIECDVDIWSNKELTKFLLASKDKAKEHGFVGFTFRKNEG